MKAKRIMNFLESDSHFYLQALESDISVGYIGDGEWLIDSIETTDPLEAIQTVINNKERYGLFDAFDVQEEDNG